MLFNSHLFLFLFLPLTLAGVALCRRVRRRWPSLLVLVAASLVFYGWWNWRYLALLIGSMAFNYAWAAWLHRLAAGAAARRTRMALGAGIAVNLALLAYFKYANFFVDSVNAALGVAWHLDAVVLPLAISFFTFEQITYLVAAARRDAPPHSALDYAVFMTFFPRLIAGPIVRPNQILPQLTGRGAVVEADGVALGLFIFAIGLFKKVVIADTFAPWVGPVFDDAGVVPFFDAWGALLAFMLQIYFDFSGYTDMAIGLGRMFGIVLPENFDSPYQARSITDYWRRWHMTLSAFLRDYVYVPLGGNRVARLRSGMNVLVTMLLGGLWHGANWTYVVWGGLHGMLLLVDRQWRRLGRPLPGGLAWALTFLAVALGFVLFRAPSFARAGVVYEGLLGMGGFAWDSLPFSFGRHEWKRILPALALVLFCPNRQTIMAWQWRSDLAYAAVFAVLTTVCILRLGDPAPFVYFQF